MSIVNKRHAEADLPFNRFQKRKVAGQSLFVGDYEKLCAGMLELSHVPKLLPPTNDFDLLLNAFHDFNFELPAGNWKRPLEDLLDLDWHVHLQDLDRVHTDVRRAIILCEACGIETFRDILWFNDSLSQPASLQKFPNCLIDISYHLTAWKPRRTNPRSTIQEWSNAWQALTIAWPLIVRAMPPELRTPLMIRRYARPPVSANWFEFNYFDGIFNKKEPVLCYHEDPGDATETEVEHCPSVASVWHTNADNLLLMESNHNRQERP